VVVVGRGVGWWWGWFFVCSGHCGLDQTVVFKER
jgi:hypothetical protein